MRVLQLAFSEPFEIGTSWACVHRVSTVRLPYWVYTKEACRVVAATSDGCVAASHLQEMSGSKPPCRVCDRTTARQIRIDSGLPPIARQSAAISLLVRLVLFGPAVYLWVMSPLDVWRVNYLFNVWADAGAEV